MELRAIFYSVFSVLLSIANVESRGPQQVSICQVQKIHLSYDNFISFYLKYYFLDSGNMWISFKASKCTS